MPKKNNACFKITIFTNRGNEERKKQETKIAIIEHKEKAKLTK